MPAPPALAAAPAPAPATLIPAALPPGARSFLVEAQAWVTGNWSDILIALAIASGIALALWALRGWAVRALHARSGTLGWGDILARTAARTGSFFIVMAALRLVTGYTGPPAAIARTIGFLFTVAAVVQAALWLRELILGAIERRTQDDRYAGEALASAIGIIRLLVTVALFAIALIVVLDNLGVNVTGLVAGLGVGGIAIGLAAQGIFADLFAALAILLDRPFRRGDRVSYDQTTGTIEAIGLKSTRIRSLTGEERIIANKQLLEKEIQNLSTREHIRIQLKIGVAYETPVATLEAIPAMLRAIAGDAGVEVVRAGTDGFGASAIEFALWFNVAGDDWDAAHAARDAIVFGIVRRFRDAGITIPYPTQTTYTAAPDGRLVLPYPEGGFGWPQGQTR